METSDRIVNTLANLVLAGVVVVIAKYSDIEYALGFATYVTLSNIVTFNDLKS